MNNQPAPNTLFLAYAVGCVGSLLQKGDITEHQHKLLRSFAQNGNEPPDELMELCFPKACQRIGRPRTFERVQHFWRTTHLNLEEESPVYIMSVVSLHEHEEISLVKVVPVTHGLGTTGYYENIRRLALKREDMVYVHGMVIAEICNQ